MERVVRENPVRDHEWTRRLTRLFARDKLPVADDGTAGAVSPNQDRGARREAFSLAIASGKGGTGKSFLATNLAVALYHRRRRVTLVDCDFGLANDHLLMGVNPALSIQHFFAGAAELHQVRVPTPFGPDLLPGGSGISRLGDLTEVELLKLGAGLAQVAAATDVMLMDAAAGISPQSVLTLLAARHVLIVTNPEIAALTDAYALIKCLSRHDRHPQISVVVNRVVNESQGDAVFRKLADVSERFSGCEIHYSGAIPEEPIVSHHRLNQPPLVVSHPTCPASQAVFAILHQLEQRHGPLGQQRVRRNGVEQRLQAGLRRRSAGR